jgi:hypothetical protein
MKCCDVASGTKTVALHRQWTVRIVEELFNRECRLCGPLPSPAPPCPPPCSHSPRGPCPTGPLQPSHQPLPYLGPCPPPPRLPADFVTFAEGDMEKEQGLPVAQFSTSCRSILHPNVPSCAPWCALDHSINVYGPPPSFPRPPPLAVDRVLCNLPNSQQGFLNFVVKPIYTAVVETFPKGQVRGCTAAPVFHPPAVSLCFTR